jgi:hypothetical protein
MLSGKLRKGELDESQTRPMVDMDRADGCLGGVVAANRKILVPAVFLAERMHGWRLFPATSFLVGCAAYDARCWRADRVDRWRSPNQIFKLIQYRTIGSVSV